MWKGIILSYNSILINTYKRNKRNIKLTPERPCRKDPLRDAKFNGWNGMGITSKSLAKNIYWLQKEK